MTIAENILKIKTGIGNARLIAVSKTIPEDKILEAYNAGQLLFGENKVQELVRKRQNLPVDIEWHFIGHLQTNKVRQISPFVSLIHGVDSLKLLQAIDKEGKKIGRIIPCLLQFHIAEEETKFGFSYDEAVIMLTSSEFSIITNVTICGVMGMATFTENNEQVRKEFRQLKHIFNKLKSDFFGRNSCFSEISMGMSSDYPIAVEEGSTLVRIGTSVFGVRNSAR